MKKKSPSIWIAHLALFLVGTAAAHPVCAGSRLPATSGVSQVEGAAGGGLSPWALIAGGGSRDEIGASAFATRVQTRGGYVLEAAGAALGLYDTVELSAARWRFGLSDTVPGQSLRLEVFGLKWRVFGDAVYDADRPWPQIALGLQHKRNRGLAVPELLGARRGSDTEPYVSATKLWLGGAGGYNLLGNLTLRGTRANQMGLLGFGGDRGDRLRLQPEVSLAVLPHDALALGVEWRAKPSLLSAAPETRALDVFLAWWPYPGLSLTLAYLDLGQIANKTAQRSSYLSLQAQF
ncbi:DUF3034 family protein [Paucibacter sp. DJ2R-2]|uniref:DUF3034 family protein n=1 Tax=Paucibacter sp. DJ2R-2 TaxID=2893558 RepID=UPI0021E3C9B2|nr:DUF3034 family protein [Paucibacter sp. DJ2R-2]MCV2419682.1 DUF3034 family protein [Paucibacter sp. DJ4R-1]MCV2437415.1 DUF3034 family protein [Paucibacter sp. DJ2R-2]